MKHSARPPAHNARLRLPLYLAAAIWSCGARRNPRTWN